MTDPREAALAWIRTAIAEERPQDSVAAIEQAAEALHASAEEYGVPIDELIVWIHRSGPKLDFGKWKAHAIEFSDLQQRLGKVPQ